MRLRIWQAQAIRLVNERRWPFLLLVLLAGCTRNSPYSPVEVSGKVLYKGKPVPGGTVKFVTSSGGYAAFATIDEDGSYRIKSSIGEVKIGIDNRLLRPSPKPRGSIGGHKIPEAEAPKVDSQKGHYVPLPTKYYSPDTSGLTYTVENKPQTHYIVLE
jgi:hypothetical protein